MTMVRGVGFVWVFLFCEERNGHLVRLPFMPLLMQRLSPFKGIPGCQRKVFLLPQNGMRHRGNKLLDFTTLPVR